MWLLATIYVQLLVEDLMFVQQHFSSLVHISVIFAIFWHTFFFPRCRGKNPIAPDH